MKISTKDVREGDLIRLSDGTKGEVVRIHKPSTAMFRFAIYLKDEWERVGPHFVNEAGSVEIIDTIKTHNPFARKDA